MKIFNIKKFTRKHKDYLIMINVLDIGCRYGIYPSFKSNINTLNYIGVDADIEEIKRLKKNIKILKILYIIIIFY